jgi:hypothetical protein
MDNAKEHRASVSFGPPMLQKYEPSTTFAGEEKVAALVDDSSPAVQTPQPPPPQITRQRPQCGVASPDTATDPMTTSPMQPNDWAARASRRQWTPEEDTNLTTAVKTTCKKKYDEEYRTDRVAIGCHTGSGSNERLVSE